MEVRDLRIGNLIYDSYCGYLAISAINERSVLAHKPGMVTSGCFDINKIESIPLTEEILLRCGARKVLTLIYRDMFRLEWREARKCWIVTDFDGEGYIAAVEFLHEWQNVYHALTKEELQFTF